MKTLVDFCDLEKSLALHTLNIEETQIHHILNCADLKWLFQHGVIDIVFHSCMALCSTVVQHSYVNDCSTVALHSCLHNCSTVVLHQYLHNFNTVVWHSCSHNYNTVALHSCLYYYNTVVCHSGLHNYSRVVWHSCLHNYCTVIWHSCLHNCKSSNIACMFTYTGVAFISILLQSSLYQLYCITVYVNALQYCCIHGQHLLYCNVVH